MLRHIVYKLLIVAQCKHRPIDIYYISFQHICISAAWCQSGMKVLVPKTLNATSSSCLLIPCQFTISKEKEVFLTHSSVVTWRKGSLWSLYDTDHFTNAERQKEPQMKVVGDLRKKNCTSVMMNLTSQHSDRYFFKFQSVGFSIVETKAVSIHVSGKRVQMFQK